MTGFLLNMLKGMITKELLLKVFNDVVLETVLDIVTQFAKSTSNPYDDQLVAHLQKFIEDNKPFG